MGTYTVTDPLKGPLEKRLKELEQVRLAIGREIDRVSQEDAELRTEASYYDKQIRSIYDYLAAHSTLNAIMQEREAMLTQTPLEAVRAR